ncbi:hypothetical protein BH10PLA2_BH10PLA2_08300 [soil metagenome]
MSGGSFTKRRPRFPSGWFRLLKPVDKALLIGAVVAFLMSYGVSALADLKAKELAAENNKDRVGMAQMR